MAVKLYTPPAGTDAPAPGQAPPEHFTITWEGLVVGTGEANGYDDSDFYAIVWDEALGAPKHVTYGSTAYWSYYNTATVDAPPEIMDKYNAWMAAARLQLAADLAAKEAATVREGKTVTVVKGRKVAPGTTGIVFWTGPGKYGDRVGFTDAAGTAHWADVKNVEVTAPEGGE